MPDPCTKTKKSTEIITGVGVINDLTNMLTVVLSSFKALGLYYEYLWYYSSKYVPIASDPSGKSADFTLQTKSMTLSNLCFEQGKFASTSKSSIWITWSRLWWSAYSASDAPSTWITSTNCFWFTLYLKLYSSTIRFILSSIFYWRTPDLSWTNLSTSMNLSGNSTVLSFSSSISNLIWHFSSVLWIALIRF